MSVFEPSSEHAFSSVLNEFLSDYRPPAVSAKTAAYYNDQLGRAFRQFLEPLCESLEDITPKIMRAYFQHEATAPKYRPTGGYQRAGVHQRATAPIGEYSLDHRWRSAWRFFEWCIEQEYIAGNPMKRVKRPATPKLIREGFTDDEVARLLHCAGPDPLRPQADDEGGMIPVRDRAIVTMLLSTALRADELLQMRLSRTDGERRRTIIRVKGGAERIVLFGLPADAALRAWLEVRPHVASDHVWLSARRGPLTYGTLNAMLHAVAERAGVRNATAHIWRHTGATAYYERTRDLMATAAYLRHSRPETTVRYLKRLGVDYNARAGYATPDEWLAGAGN